MFKYNIIFLCSGVLIFSLYPLHASDDSGILSASLTGIPLRSALKLSPSTIKLPHELATKRVTINTQANTSLDYEVDFEHDLEMDRLAQKLQYAQRMLLTRTVKGYSRLMTSRLMSESEMKFGEGMDIKKILLILNKSRLKKPNVAHYRSSTTGKKYCVAACDSNAEVSSQKNSLSEIYNELMVRMNNIDGSEEDFFVHFNGIHNQRDDTLEFSIVNYGDIFNEIRVYFHEFKV